MTINHYCVIKLIEKYGFVNDYTDNYTTTVVYYFGSDGQIRFEESCISMWLAKKTLNQFNLGSKVGELQTEKCIC